MWNRLRLSLKLTIALVCMQLISVTVGSVILMSWLKRSRLTEIDRRIDAEADAIGDALAPAGNNDDVVLHVQGEVIGDLYHDRFFYFQVVGSDGSTKIESLGPDPAHRKKLAEALAHAGLPSEQSRDLLLDGEDWRISKEALDHARFPDSGTVMYVARNLDQEHADLDQVRRYLALGSAVLVLVASVGSAFIVSTTTANLQRFSRELEAVKPEGPLWEPPGAPRSAEERQLFQSFRRLLGSIRDAFAAQRLFVANASHELKSPVAGMMIALEVMLSRPRTPEEYQQTGRELLRTVRGLRKLTTTLLDLARVESGASQSATRSNEVGSLVQVVVDRLLPYARERGVQLSLEESGTESWLECDDDLLAVALTNLVENAIKYTEAAGVVTVTVANDPDAVRVVVRDTGCGMEAADLGQLGQMFFRADQSRSVEMSYGLGFAQAKRIVEALNGALVVKSRQGQGTEVLVILRRQRRS